MAALAATKLVSIAIGKPIIKPLPLLSLTILSPHPPSTNTCQKAKTAHKEVYLPQRSSLKPETMV